MGMKGREERGGYREKALFVGRPNEKRELEGVEDPRRRGQHEARGCRWNAGGLL